MPHTHLQGATTPAGLLGAAEGLGLEAALDAPLLGWFDATRLSPLTARIVQRLALTQGCGTARILLGNARVWDALGRAVAPTVLDDLGEWITEVATREGMLAAGGAARPVDPRMGTDDGGEAVAPGVGARTAGGPPNADAAPTEDAPRATASGLAWRMSPEALRAWAEARGVAPELARPATVLDDRVIGRARTWFWRAGNATVEDVIARAGGFAVPVPEEIPEAAVEWLEERARRVARALLDERTLLDGLSPPRPPLRELWDRLQAERAALRAAVAPVPADEASRPRLVATDDSPAWTLQDGYTRLCSVGAARATIRLQPAPGEPLLQCSCNARCALGLVAVDTLLFALGHPTHPQHGWLAVVLGTRPWERALGELDALLAAGTADDGVLGWRVDVEQRSIAPLVCRPKKRGEGWKIAKLPREELAERPALCVLPGDRDARELVLADPQGHAFAAALARLVGHPRVFAGSEPVSVKRGALATQWMATDDEGVRVSFTLGGITFFPAEVREMLAGPPGWRAEELHDGIHVYEVDAAAIALVDALARTGGVFPKEAAPALLARLAPLSRVVPARVAPELRGAERPADERTLLRIDALSDGGLLVSALVRPLPGGPAFPPGEGPDELHAGHAEDRVHVARVRALEPARVRAALSGLPLLATAEGPPFTWTLADAEAALDLVSALQGRPPTGSDGVLVEWAGPPRRTRAVTAGNLNLRVTSSRDWLDVKGGLDVDGQTVELGALLSAVLAGRRYVAVDEDTWVRLGDELTEQLAAVAEVSTGDDGAELPTLAAPVLEGLQAAGAAIEAPPGWDALVGRARAVEGWEPALPAGFTAELRDYQRAGFAWMARLARWAPGACLADDMGLGKTVQALALLAHRAELGPALIVAPTSVGFNWLREAARFAPGLRVRALRGADRLALLADLGPGDVLVTSWDLLPRDIDALEATRFATLVLDEAQAMKNATTARAKAAARVPADFRVALTGTPVENRVSELWSLFRVVAPGLLGSWERFRSRFALAIERDDDRRRRAALARLIRPFLLRRLKSEVARELPPRTDIRVEIVLSREERQLYDAARAAFVAQLEGDAGPPEQRRFKVLAALTRLRQLACHPRLLDPDTAIGSSKLARLLELVAELRAEGHRALVFSQFTRQLGLVRDALTREGVPLRYLDGDTPEAKRRAEVDAFQQGDGDVFLISLKAGGTGLTLTAATYVIHLDPWWNPAVEDQASDRAHRIGQTQPVTVYRLVAKGTIEEKILALHGEKRALVEGLLEGTGDAATMGTDELVALLTAADEEPVEDEGG